MGNSLLLLLNSILNSKQAVRKITVGTSNSLTSHTFNVSAMLNNYKTLSVDDFEIVTTGSVSYSFDVSAYLQYSITADNIVLSDVCGSASAKDDYNGWSDFGSVTPSFSLSDTTVSVRYPYYYSKNVWYEGQANAGWRAFSIYSTCKVYLLYVA